MRPSVKEALAIYDRVQTDPSHPCHTEEGAFRFFRQIAEICESCRSVELTRDVEKFYALFTTSPEKYVPPMTSQVQKKVFLTHDEVKKIHDRYSGNLTGPMHEQSGVSLDYRDRIAELFGGDKDGWLEGDALCEFHERFAG